VGVVVGMEILLFPRLPRMVSIRCRWFRLAVVGSIFCRWFRFAAVSLDSPSVDSSLVRFAVVGFDSLRLVLIRRRLTRRLALLSHSRLACPPPARFAPLPCRLTPPPLRLALSSSPSPTSLVPFPFLLVVPSRRRRRVTFHRR